MVQQTKEKLDHKLHKLVVRIKLKIQEWISLFRTIGWEVLAA